MNLMNILSTFFFDIYINSNVNIYSAAMNMMKSSYWHKKYEIGKN